MRFCYPLLFLISTSIYGGVPGHRLIEPFLRVCRHHPLLIAPLHSFLFRTFLATWTAFVQASLLTFPKTQMNTEQAINRARDVIPRQHKALSIEETYLYAGYACAGEAADTAFEGSRTSLGQVSDTFCPGSDTFCPTIQGKMK